MSKIIKCESCGKQVYKNNHSFPFCSPKCIGQHQQKEAAMDGEMQEWSSLCAAAIKKGEAETGRKFEDAGDALIDSWITKYALTSDNG
jgi:endogenous inhibitor of DNA gyrase (YacG/DUF329 family)